MSGGSGQAGGVGQPAIKPLASLQNAAATVNRAPQGVSQNSTGPVFAEDAAKLNVGRLYQDQFGRQADQDGLNFWVNQMRQGQTLNDIRGKLAGSAEAQARQSQQAPMGQGAPGNYAIFNQALNNPNKDQLAQYINQYGPGGEVRAQYAAAHSGQGWQPGASFTDYAMSVLGPTGYQDAVNGYNKAQLWQLQNANYNQQSPSN